MKELDPAIFTKSGIMVGLGEERNEVLQLMDDLRSAEVDFLTIGQYLQPTRKHHPVIRFVTPDEFKAYETTAYAKGFLLVSATPLTRSSHHAGEDFARLEGGAPRRSSDQARRCRPSAPPGSVQAYARRRCSTSWPTWSAIRSSCRSAKRLRVVRRSQSGEGVETLVAAMSVGYKAIRESFTSRVTLDRPRLRDPRRIRRRALQIPREPLDLSDPPRAGCEVEFYINYEFKSFALGLLMGVVFDTRLPASPRLSRSGPTRSTAGLRRQRRAGA